MISKEFEFVIVGNSRFGGIFHREQALALELARLGYTVRFIEEVPSLASRVRSTIQRFIFPLGLQEKKVGIKFPPTLHVYKPPMVPTFYRSSYTPLLDRFLFRKWFKRIFKNQQWNRTILIAMFPYLWDGYIDLSDAQVRFTVYDIYDAPELFSRNSSALKRFLRGEERLRRHLNMVTYSGKSMEKDVQRNFRTTPTLWVPNALPEWFVPCFSEMKTRKRERTTIGYLGTTDPRWFDEELFIRAVATFPQYEFILRASPDYSFHRKLKKYKNVRLVEFLEYSELPDVLDKIDIGIIPFRRNEITRVINPIKMYEYAVAGIPIVASQTEELMHYSELLYLASDADDFIRLIQKAVEESNGERSQLLRNFAVTNTWSARVRSLLDAIEQILREER